MDDESSLADAVSKAIDAGKTPKQFIEAAAEQWKLELQDRMDNAAFNFDQLLNGPRIEIP